MNDEYLLTEFHSIKAMISNLIGLQIYNTQQRLKYRKSTHAVKQDVDILPIPTASVSESFQETLLLTTDNSKPIEFESETVIEEALYEWRVRYPAQPLPGTKYESKASKSLRSSSTGIYNSCVLKLYRIFAFTDRMMWLLRLEDQKLLLLKQMPEVGKVRGYVAWTGGAQGFGTEFVVHPESNASAPKYSLRSSKRLQRRVAPSIDPVDSKICANYPITPDDTPLRSSFGRILRSPIGKAPLLNPYKKSRNNKISPRNKMRRGSLKHPTRRGCSEEASGTI